MLRIKPIKILEYVSGLLLAVMLVSIMIQIVLRNIFNVGLGWTEEMARYTMIWLTYIGAIVSLKQGSHIAIKLLIDRFSPKWKEYTSLISNLMILFFLFFLLKEGIKLNRSPVIIHQLTPGMQVPTNFLYSVIPVCISMMMIVIVAQIIQGVRKLAKARMEDA